MFLSTSTLLSRSKKRRNLDFTWAGEPPIGNCKSYRITLPVTFWWSLQQRPSLIPLQRRLLLAPCRLTELGCGHCFKRECGRGCRFVKWFNATKGYGFIQPDAGGKDVFVHISAVEKAGFTGLAEGAKISYEVVSDRGKESAGNLRIG